MVLQALYGLSDDRTEFCCAALRVRSATDCRSCVFSASAFMTGCRTPGLSRRRPGTIWLFRELLVRAKAVEKLFDAFDARLRDHGYLAMSGQIVDATIPRDGLPARPRAGSAAPKQRNNDAEKDALKAGRVPEEWRDKPAKLRQKDRDARWTMKRGRVQRLADGLSGIPCVGVRLNITLPWPL